ncbi:MAG TPA: LptF/LptG family permease, partial [Phycisphaerales bacterium]|nr:LptF/LptG family permease [Phycisphaerales bacterium]
MRIITRYVVFELFKTFAVILTVITMLLLFILLAQRAIQEGLEPLLVIRLTPYLIPDVLRLAIPATMLLATCVVYGKMSGANEIIAVKANGGSPMVVVWPAIVLAFAISLFAVWLNDIAVSWGRTGVDRIILRSVEDIVYGMLRTQRAYSNSRFSIHVKDVEDRKLIRPTISFHARDNAP